MFQERARATRERASEKEEEGEEVVVVVKEGSERAGDLPLFQTLLPLAFSFSPSFLFSSQSFSSPSRPAEWLKPSAQPLCSGSHRRLRRRLLQSQQQQPSPRGALSPRFLLCRRGSSLEHRRRRQSPSSPPPALSPPSPPSDPPPSPPGQSLRCPPRPPTPCSRYEGTRERGGVEEERILFQFD